MAGPTAEPGPAWRFRPQLTRTSRVALPSASLLITSRGRTWFTRTPRHRPRSAPGSDPAFRALPRQSGRRRRRTPRRSGWARRPGLGHSPPDVTRLVPAPAEYTAPADLHWRGCQAASPQRAGWHARRPAVLRRRRLTIRVRFFGRRHGGIHSHDGGHRHQEQQDHECQRGFEHLIQHGETQISHSSLLSQPVAGSCPVYPVSGGPNTRLLTAEPSSRIGRPVTNRRPLCAGGTTARMSYGITIFTTIGR